jgi:uncharacterized protein YjbI with pentapeptide repeats
VVEVAGGRWDSCRWLGCGAQAAEEVDLCWGHASDDELRPALRRLEEDGVLAARNVGFTIERLLLVLGTLASDGDGRPILRRADVQGASFAPGVSFDRVRFTGDVTFEDAIFAGPASFDGCAFEGTSWFTKTRFADSVTFERATFPGKAWFHETEFATATFTRVSFDSDVSFQDASFAVRGGFEDVRFGADLTVTRVRAKAVAFDKVTFAGATTFSGMTVETETGFASCMFSATRQLGRIESRMLDLSDSVWNERAVVEAVADRVVATGTRFLSGVQMRLGRAEVTIEGADFAAPSILTSPAEPADTPPRLVSLSGADVAGLTLSGVDLTTCEFAGAHHLSQLRIDDCTFAATPAEWWRARRQAVVEEARWRAERSATRRARTAWERSLQSEHPDESEPVRPALRVNPDQIAAIYRELRRGREDAKDEPGAADFYYGEMEMRRLATSARHRRTSTRSAAGAAGEHAILTLYWLVSGYGLRAWRAFVGLGALVLVSGVAVARWGIDDDASADLSNGLLVSARAAAVGLAGSDIPLTAFGAWLQLTVRLLGPVLLGLALLAIRGRVRR